MSELPTNEEQPRRRPTGRRAGDSGTREAILDAALRLFAERGYDGASLRAIAAEAQVDHALIRHFFGDKETLFVTTIADRTPIAERLLGAFAGDPAGLGRRVTDAYLRLWEDDATRPVLLALVRSATTSHHAADTLRDVLGARAQEAGAPGGSVERLRSTSLAVSHLFGVAVTRHVVRLPAMVDVDHDTLVDEIAPTIQRYLVG